MIRINIREELYEGLGTEDLEDLQDALISAIQQVLEDFEIPSDNIDFEFDKS